jgi:polyisoprenoid-binding protein YceI
MPLDSPTPASTPSTTYELGPANASLQVKTYREGIAQKVGHDLVIDVTAWSGTLVLNGDTSSVSLDADSGSLEVREGHNGVKPLSDKDRGEIRKNIDAKILKQQPISFRSTQVQRSANGLSVQGNLSIGDTSRPVQFELAMDGNRVQGIVPLVQREFGIKPYSAMMGALKVRDDIEIVVDAPLS